LVVYITVLTVYLKILWAQSWMGYC